MLQEEVTWRGIQITPPARPLINTIPRFQAVDTSQPPLANSPSPLRPESWRTALKQYPGDLGQLLYNILIFGAQIGYIGPSTRIISKNLSSANDDPASIEMQLQIDLTLKRVSPHPGTSPFVSSPLGLVPKPGNRWRRIHHLSYPPGNSVNDGIEPDTANLVYTSILQVFDHVRQAGRGSYLIKKDLQDAFRMVPIATHQRWLLGFQWNGVFYHENCLPFGLRTAPFIFNLFAEALHWLLQATVAWLGIAHYLDDFIFVIPKSRWELRMEVHESYDYLTSYLGLPQNKAKDDEGTCVEVLGIEIDTITMSAQLSAKKITKAAALVAATLTRGTLTLHEAQQLAGFLSFCSTVVRLGRTFLASIWRFISSFKHKRASRPLAPPIIDDLTWWQTMLPQFNGILLLADTDRTVFHLFTDASGVGLGGFWYKAAPSEADWQRIAQSLPQSHSFATPYPLVPGTSINTNEIVAIQTAVCKWAPKWAHGTIIIHTDNTTAESGLRTGTTNNENSMKCVRNILVLCAAHDINVHPVRVTTTDNGLADVLSRFQWAQVANICPHWKIPTTFA